MVRILLDTTNEAAIEVRVRQTLGGRYRQVDVVAIASAAGAGELTDRVHALRWAAVVTNQATQVTLTLAGQKQPQRALTEHQVDARAVRAGIGQVGKRTVQRGCDRRPRRAPQVIQLVEPGVDIAGEQRGLSLDEPRLDAAREGECARCVAGILAREVEGETARAALTDDRGLRTRVGTGQEVDPVDALLVGYTEIPAGADRRLARERLLVTVRTALERDRVDEVVGNSGDRIGRFRAAAEPEQCAAAAEVRKVNHADAVTCMHGCGVEVCNRALEHLLRGRARAIREVTVKVQRAEGDARAEELGQEDLRVSLEGVRMADARGP